METTSNGGPSAFFEKYGTALAVVVGALIIGGALAFGQGGGDKAATPDPVAVDIKDVKTDTGPFVGAKNAPVTIAVWFDYQCGFCKQYETTTIQEVIATYGDQVRIVHKDFQFLGTASNDAALYSRAVWDAYPERWKEWYAGMFVAGPDSEGTLNVAAMDALSSELGLDVARLTALRLEKNDEYQALLDADRNEGQSFGINGTPGTIVGTTLLSGAQPFSALKPLIDAELAK